MSFEYLIGIVIEVIIFKVCLFCWFSKILLFWLKLLLFGFGVLGFFVVLRELRLERIRRGVCEIGRRVVGNGGGMGLVGVLESGGRLIVDFLLVLFKRSFDVDCIVVVRWDILIFFFFKGLIIVELKSYFWGDDVLFVLEFIEDFEWLMLVVFWNGFIFWESINFNDCLFSLLYLG